MEHDLKALIVGGGSAGVRHFRYLTEYGVSCSVCDPADTCRVTQTFPDAKHHRDMKDADLGAFDAVVICTPPFLHVPQALRAAAAGCHVLMEKPIAVTEEGLDELEATVRDKGIVAAVAFPFANMRAWDRIVDIVRSGEIGDLWMASYHKGENILKARPDYLETYYVDEALGGGCLQDDANHAAFALERLCGPIAEITAQVHNIGIKDTKSDDTCFVWMKFRSGVVANLDWSNQSSFGLADAVIACSKGGIRFSVAEMEVQVLNAETGEVREEAFDDTWNDTFRRNDENFVDAIRGDAEVKCTIQQARASLRTILLARESARLGRSISVT